jgi:hypothetical protein
VKLESGALAGQLNRHADRVEVATPRRICSRVEHLTRSANIRIGHAYARPMADDLTARLAALETRHAQLEHTIAQLRLELGMRKAGFRSMRDSRRCPACSNEALLHVRRASAMTGGVVGELALAYDIAWTSTHAHGPLEAFVCRRCSLVELHALDIEHVPVDGAKIIAIEPEEPPTGGPFR